MQPGALQPTQGCNASSLATAGFLVGRYTNFFSIDCLCCCYFCWNWETFDSYWKRLCLYETLSLSAFCFLGAMEIFDYTITSASSQISAAV